MVVVIPVSDQNEAFHHFACLFLLAPLPQDLYLHVWVRALGLSACTLSRLNVRILPTSTWCPHMYNSAALMIYTK